MEKDCLKRKYTDFALFSSSSSVMDSSDLLRERLAQFRTQAMGSQTPSEPTELYKPIEHRTKTRKEIEEEYMKKVFIMKPMPERFAELKNLTFDLRYMRPVSYIFPDATLKGEPGFTMVRMLDGESCELGRHILPMLSSGFTRQGAAALFQLAYNMKKPKPYYTGNVFGDVTEYVSLADLAYSDLRDSKLGGPNRPANVYSDSGTARDAASYCYLAASLLRLFTKSAENYVKDFEHICSYFLKFYGYSMTIQLPKPEASAIQGLSDWFSADPRAKQTLYRLLILSNKDSGCTGLTRFAFEMHLSLTGMHLVTFLVSLAKLINCTFTMLLNIIDVPQFSRQFKALLEISKLFENVDGLHSLGIWKYGRIFDETFMSDLQAKSCPKLVYIVAAALKSEAPETYQNITNMAQLKDVSDESRVHCEHAAREMIKTIKKAMKGNQASYEGNSSKPL